MSNKLFAFKVSKKAERTDKQWIGDQTARAVYKYCSGGQGYGLNNCVTNPVHTDCVAWGTTGYYICDTR
jgi:hypothetical protein